MAITQIGENVAVIPAIKGSKVKYKGKEGEIIELNLCRVRIKPNNKEKPFWILRGDRRIEVIE